MKDIPSSVYRIQVGADFPLARVTELVPYFFELGIDAIYTSPSFEAYQTGYDVINPHRLNPALGSYEDFEKLCNELQHYKMKFLLDVVPNHMGTKGNPWWLDVLEKGRDSPYANFFDINWDINPKLVLPILNAPYQEVLRNGELQLVWDNGFFWIHYFDYVLPINKDTYPLDKPGPSEKQNPDLLHALLEKQRYHLTSWKEAGEEINYRRFFNINDLAAIHAENEKVFVTYHQWIFELIQTGKVYGLRIDHPDGLYDPALYFKWLRERNIPFVWIEKILDPGEKLSKNWEIEGTVGYDFLNVLSGSFVQKKNAQKMTEIYHHFIEEPITFQQTLYQRRKSYISHQMKSELNFLASQLAAYSKDFTKNDFLEACMEIMACFPVYRTYIRPRAAIHKNDRKYILQAVELAKQQAAATDPSLFDYIKGFLLLEHTGRVKKRATDLVMRFQQLTPTIMAKGLEDSTFYIYNRLISLNEVGCNPDDLGSTKKEFHAFNQDKLKSWPLGGLASSTHDTKFSEDARFRLHVLSEIPDLWETHVNKWKEQNAPFKTGLFPDLNTEYYLYQMLIAIWPADSERIWSCLEKAIREAGLYTSWHTIDPAYETAVKQFLISILSPISPFLASFIPFQQQIAAYGLLNSLSALVLKVGSCGIVDLYQGNESTQFCPMDPDNRRAVDFQSLKEKLQKGDIKATITRQALNFRRKHRDLFLQGNYVPLKTSEKVIGFMRKLNDQEVIVLAGRFFAEAMTPETTSIPKKIESKVFKDIFTQQEVTIHKDGLHLQDVFKKYPFAILASF